MATRAPSQDALANLRRLMPDDRISTTDADRYAVSQDLWPRNILRMYHGSAPALPAAVAWPQSAEEIQEIVAWANAHDVSLVPYGAGSGVVGGTSANRDQVVLDLKRMQQVRAIDPTGRTCTAEAGIMGELLERRLQRAGMSQGHFPSSIYCSTLGGWLATRSAGQASCRYGKIEDQVLGGVVVLGDGSAVTQTPRPGLSPLFAGLTGSEGVLGIWAEATLRVHPLPETRAFMAFDFPNLDRALQAARAVLLAGLTPSILRIYDPLDTLLHRDTHGRRVHRDRGPSWSAAVGALLPGLVSYVGDHLSHQCRCIIITEGARSVVKRDAQSVADIVQAYAGRSRGAEPAKTWYAKRYAVSYRMSNVFRAGVAVDTMEVACPWEHLLPVYEAVKRAALGCGAQVMAHFSHLYLEGGSIYFTYAMPAMGGESTYDRLWDATLTAAVDHGANVSHHHGVGQLKSAALHRAKGDYGAALNRLRRVCDPKQILNPATLSMHSTAPARGKTVLPEIGAQARWMISHPDETLGDVEARAQQNGQTLGWAASLFVPKKIIDAARSGQLWRINPQLGVIESLVMGVDATLDNAHHRFVPAPRAAEGPDLQVILLEQEVTSLWLRTQKIISCHWHVRMPRADAVAAAKQLVHHPLAQRLQCAMLWCGRGEVDIYLTADHAQASHAEAVAKTLPGATRQISWQVPDLPENAQGARFSAGWGEADAGMATAFDDATEAFAWVDPAGLLGFVDVRTHGDLVTRGQVTSWFDGGVLQTAATRRAVFSNPETTATTTALCTQPVDNTASVCLLEPRPAHRAALENCTYCPKLCRFSCPVTTATANEAHIPRQMMLATRMDVMRQRPLSESVARTLYSCVDCRGCRTFCDHDNDVASVLQQTRSQLWKTDKVPAAVRNVCEHLARTGTMPDTETATTLSAWPKSEGDQTRLFFGCQNDAASAVAMRGAHALVQAFHGTTGWMNGGSQCCGHPLYRWGHHEAFISHAKRFAARLPRALQLLVVDDPGCVYTLQTLYRDVAGVSMPDIAWVADLLPKQVLAPSMSEHALHDACFATRWLGNPTLRSAFAPDNRAPKSVLEGEAGCCGGMLLPYYDRPTADSVARQRAQDLQCGTDRRIVSPSPTCSRRLRQVQAPVDDLLALWLRDGVVATRQGPNLV